MRRWASLEKQRQQIGFTVKQINNVYEKDLNERLKKLGVTSSQCAVLDFLFHTDKDEVNQCDVEKALSLKNPTVTGILKRLDEKGFIFSVPNTQDKRKKNIYLTEKAYDIQRRMEADRKKLDKELTRGMTKKEIAALTRGLEKMLYNISEP
ncbi:MAG: MarR family transcriptional regulator [Ruminococcus sp.]|nr:MarR family transcriptional regulator [Ruminococcus sp.]